MAIDEDMLASMTDEEIEEYFNKLYGEEEMQEMQTVRMPTLLMLTQLSLNKEGLQWYLN